ncbi:hypothetical protein [Cerasicoccus arenae]|uniref:Uncharacterized protein n=1 Tax=Cerasicoccus arenae TaxID=424488 RepID=A0A8J3DA75_9BACT|nr:hypothetical protein [Cerasicoccus arenae]MBK1859436.1 hypothetical protein [Cerasicoccus arenae]GHB94113.1 hypothetical protein GCM10007047_07210 [Cerasicoccus arenae]
MSAYDFDNSSDGDWENSEELSWNEFDWQRYLKQNEKDIGEFLGHYHRLKHKPGHLDEIAQLMRWEVEDWSGADLEESDDDFEEEEEKEAVDASDFDPYSVHKHPVYIVSHGLYQHLFQCWEHFLTQTKGQVDAVMGSRFASSLHVGEFNAVMGINALDMGDFNLAVCHLKNGLAAVNHTMAILQEVKCDNARLLQAFQAEVLQVIFDLRDLWLRVMNDCREEERRHKDNGR